MRNVFLISCFLLFGSELMASSLSSGPSFTVKQAYLSEQLASSTDGGAGSSGAWTIRPINTINDPDSIVTSLTSNQFTLGSGTYELIVSASIGRAVNSSRLRLYNVTSAAVQLDEAGNQCAGVNGRTSASGQGDSVHMETRFVVVGSKKFEIDHYIQSSTDGADFGKSLGSGDPEVYLEMIIRKIK